MLQRHLRLPAVVLGLTLAALAGCEASSTPAEQTSRAILVSIDALSESILRETLTPSEAPELFGVFERGMCSDYAMVGMPSVTPSSHATLWTGAFGDVTGATAGGQHRLPRSEHRVTETISGFDYAVLSADPLWVTAGLAGIPVAAHHVTQAPGVPGFPAVDGPRTPELEERRELARQALDRTDVNVLNGYNRTVVGHGLLELSDLDPAEAGDWVGLDGLPADPAPRAYRWTNAAGTFDLLMHGVEGEEGYAGISVGLSPDLSRAVTARRAPLESEPLDGREPARHFSEPLELPVEGGRTFLHLRLFDLAPDGSELLVYHPSMHLMEGNRPDLEEAYDAAVGGWIGNSAFALYRSGGLGPTLMAGGDGTAESRYLETAELLLRQFMRGSEWLWTHFEPRLQMDYFPLSDAIDHELLGYLDPEYPGYDAEIAERVREFRASVWRLVDRRLGHLIELAEASEAAVFVTGDHGMRSSWRFFRPNRALIDAGLLVLDEAGQIDLSRTRALAPNGYWISVNREAWVDGIVPPDDEASVIALAREAIEGVVDEDGRRVVTRTFTPSEQPELGIGGPAGGDLYWGTAPGYRTTGSLAGDAAVSDAPLWAGHGFPPDEPDMYTAFCAVGGPFEAGRIDGVRATVVAPTVADYTGIPIPRDATGRSVLESMWGGS